MTPITSHAGSLYAVMPNDLQSSRSPPVDPLGLIRPRRKINGMSAILLPFASGEIDWRGFTAHIARTADAGLTPAVNMDTGYVNLLDDATRREVLEQTAKVLAGRPFVAGAFVADSPDDRFNPDAYHRQIDPIVRAAARRSSFNRMDSPAKPTTTSSPPT